MSSRVPALQLRFSPLRLLRATVVVLLFMGLLFWVATPIMLTSAYLHPRHGGSIDPNTLGFPTEKISWQGRDGATLVGWFGRVSADAPVMMLGHGYGSSSASMGDYARFLYAAGYSVVILDWRGAGGSSGDGITFGVKESGDVSVLVDTLLARPDIADPPVGGLGVSMGAGLMILAAAADHRIKAVVADSAYSSVIPAIEQWNALYIRFWPNRLLLAPIAAPAGNVMLDGKLNDIDPIKNIDRVSPSAVLLIHSAKDTNGLTLPQGAEQLYAAAKEPREIAILPEGGHGAVLYGQPEEYQRRVLDFLGKYLH